MIKDETLIITPIPDWGSQAELSYIDGSCCISYLYFEDGQPQYGFHTEKSIAVFQEVFSPVIYWDFKNKRFKYIENNLYAYGINFYGESEENRSLITSFEKYHLAELKTRLQQARGVSVNGEQNKHLILDLQKDNDCTRFSSYGIKALLKNGSHFFIGASYSPELGRSVLVFDEKLKDKLYAITKKNDINFLEKKDHKGLPYS